MQFLSFRSLILLPTLLFAACNHSDITGPNDGAYVHHVTLHVPANPSMPVTASCDRTDLVVVTGVAQQ